MVRAPARVASLLEIVQSPAPRRSTITSSWNRPISLGYRASVSTVASASIHCATSRPLVSMGAEGRFRMYGHFVSQTEQHPLACAAFHIKAKGYADSRVGARQHRCGTRGGRDQNAGQR